MSKKTGLFFYLKFIGIVSLVSLPFVITFIYRAAIAPNPNVRFAGGLHGGKYDQFLRALVDDLRENSPLTNASVIESGGSYENIELLENGEIDFALFQGGADQASDLLHAHRDIAFVSNVFPEVVHLVVRNDLPEDDLLSFRFRNIAIGVPTSGDYRVGQALIKHLQLDKSKAQWSSMTYDDIVQGFQKSELDFAVLSVGMGAPVITDLIESKNCKLVDLPMRDAFLSQHIAYTPYEIPDGMYSVFGQSRTENKIETVAVNAQLITRKNVSSKTVNAVLDQLNGSKFLKQNNLIDLFRDGNKYATDRPEFEIHPGAKRYFDPRIRPMINPDFVEATEGIRSFVFSGLIGLFLLIRWLKIRNDRSHSHKLDQFIHRLLAIEQEQIKFDRDYSENELVRLEQFLDEITNLRREALHEFSAHDLNDDPAIECFISMSHALSEKINAKLTRDVVRKLSIEPQSDGE